MDQANVKLQEQELRQACAKLEQRLRSGQPVRAETLFAEYPLLTCYEDSALDLIYTEFITREDIGQRPTPEEFYARFPQWRQRLQQQFNIHEWLQEDDGELGPPGIGTAGALHVLGSYEILEEIGRGRFGVVYKAWQKGLERVVAVKVPSPASNLLPSSTDDFCREARVMAGLQHPHIMPVHDIGTGEGLVYFSMDYAAHGSLAQTLHKGKLPGPDAVALMLKLADAIQYAHQKGIIHLDLKPSNILFDDRDRPLISDFGLARMQHKTPDKAERALGTPAYMAPEQIGKNHNLTPAVDIWALGVIFYEMLSGVRPFDRKTRAALFRSILRDTPASLRQHAPDLEPRLEHVCLTCLAKEPGKRFPSMQEFVAALR